MEALHCAVGCSAAWKQLFTANLEALSWERVRAVVTAVLLPTTCHALHPVQQPQQASVRTRTYLETSCAVHLCTLQPNSSKPSSTFRCLSPTYCSMAGHKLPCRRLTTLSNPIRILAIPWVHMQKFTCLKPIGPVLQPTFSCACISGRTNAELYMSSYVQRYGPTCSRLGSPQKFMDRIWLLWYALWHVQLTQGCWEETRCTGLSCGMCKPSAAAPSLKDPARSKGNIAIRHFVPSAKKTMTQFMTAMAFRSKMLIGQGFCFLE